MSEDVSISVTALLLLCPFYEPNTLAGTTLLLLLLLLRTPTSVPAKSMNSLPHAHSSHPAVIPHMMKASSFH